MGGIFSSPPPKAPAFDYSNATIPGSSVAAYQGKIASELDATKKALGVDWWWWWLVKIIGVGLLIIAICVAWDKLADQFGWPRTGISPLPPAAPVAPANTLLITTATYGPRTPGAGLTTITDGVLLTKLQSMVSNGRLAGFIVSPSAIGLDKDPNVDVLHQLTVTYYVGYDPNSKIAMANEGNRFPDLPASGAATTDQLTIDYAEFTWETLETTDVTDIISAMIVNNKLPSFKVDASTILPALPPNSSAQETSQRVIQVAGNYKLLIKYTYGTSGSVSITTKKQAMTPALPPVIPETFMNREHFTPPAAVPPETLLSRFTRMVSGSNSSGDLLPRSLNAQTSVTIEGNRAPLSSEKEGSYGMQWWMFVKDWNYGYGKTKAVVKRSDPTNGSILNPSISLHPTDNTLSVSVSLFPSQEGGASVSQPSPAGHSGISDDVFACDVSNIPLQTWFSVSVTVFGRNLDIYIDGKLVKSCFLPGVPKPAAGNITLAPDGGFSGKICNFYHYPTMITPDDAMKFWSAGKTCNSTTDEEVVTSGTGYNVKFGVYDQLGKQVQEYAF